MARSSYIYILYEKFSTNDEPVGAFTVLHEMKTYIERNPGNYYAARHKDGRPEQPVTEVEL